MPLTKKGEQRKRALMTKRENAKRKARNDWAQCSTTYSLKKKKIDDEYYSELDKIYLKHSNKK